MISLEEAVIALKAAKESGADEASATMSFESSPQEPRTPFGESPSQVARTLAEEGASLVGSNCGKGFDLMLSVATEMKTVATVPLLIQPNAGIPSVDSKGIHYPESPDQFATFVGKMIAMGIPLIGGCCGTTPDHIAKARTHISKNARESVSWNVVKMTKRTYSLRSNLLSLRIVVHLSHNTVPFTSTSSTDVDECITQP